MQKTNFIPKTTVSKFALIAGILLIISGILHVGHLVIYASGAAFGLIFGIVYLLIGISLIRHVHVALWFGALIPVIGAALEVEQFFFDQPTLLIFYYIAASAISAAICVFLLVQHKYRIF